MKHFCKCYVPIWPFRKEIKVNTHCTVCGYFALYGSKRQRIATMRQSTNNICPICKKGSAFSTLKNDLSIREFSISGLCFENNRY